MHEPFLEWMADLFRVSGKSVRSEGTMSTTPQTKSFQLVIRRSNLGLDLEENAHRFARHP